MRTFLLQIICFVPLLWVPYVWSVSELQRVLFILLPPVAFLFAVVSPLRRSGEFRPGWHRSCWVPVLAVLSCVLHLARSTIGGRRSIEALGISVGTPPNIGDLFLQFLVWIGVLALLLSFPAPGADAGNEEDRESPVPQSLTTALVTAGALFSLLVIEQRVGMFFGRPVTSDGGSGTLAEPVYAGVFLAGLLPLFLAECFRRRSPWFRGLIVLCTAILVTGLYLTRSPVAWFSVPFTAVLFLFAAVVRTGAGEGDAASRSEGTFNFTPRSTLLAGLLLINGLLVLFVGFSSEEGRLRSALDLTERTDRIRLIRWRDTLSMIGDHPVFGVGPGNFSAVRARYRSADELRMMNTTGEEVRIPDPLRSSGNLYLDLVAEWGVPFGLLGLLLIVGYPVYWLVGLLRRSGGWDDRALARLGRTGGLVVFLVAGGAVGWFRSPACLFLFWILFGLVLFGRNGSGEGRTWRPGWIRIMGLAVSGVIGLVLLLFATGMHLVSGYYARRAVMTREGEGLTHFRTSISWYPYRPGVFQRYGDAILIHQPDRVRKAAGQYRAALRLDPYNYRLMIELGKALQRVSRRRSRAAGQKRAEALEVFRHARRLHSSLPHAHYRSGLVHLSSGKAEPAKRAFRRTLERAPGHSRARLDLIRVLAREKRRDELADQLKRLREHGFRRWGLLRNWPALRVYRNDPAVWGLLGK